MTADTDPARRQGFALLTVVGTIVALSALVAVLVSAGMQRAHMAVRLADRTRALAIAETGIAEGYRLIVSNANARVVTNLIQSTTYGDGSYSVDVTYASSNLFVLRSTGTYHGMAVPVIVALRRYVDGMVENIEPYDPFSLMILSGKSAKWKSKPKKEWDLDVIGGSVHSNTKLKVEGENTTMTAQLSASKLVELKKRTTINGDVSAPQIKKEDNVTVNGAQHVGTVPRVPIPDIDLTPYYQEALRNSTVINGDLTIKKGETVNLAPAGGILWVNGKVHIDGDGTIVGCIIATRSIKIKGVVNQTRVDSYPAFVSVNKKVEMRGSGTYHGLVYAPRGDVTFKRSVKSKKPLVTGLFTGSIIAGKKFQGEGPWSFMAYEDSQPGYPGGTKYHYSPEVIGVSAWQR